MSVYLFVCMLAIHFAVDLNPGSAKLGRMVEFLAEQIIVCVWCLGSSREYHA